MFYQNKFWIYCIKIKGVIWGSLISYFQILVPLSTSALVVTFSIVATFFFGYGVTCSLEMRTWWIFPLTYPANLLTPDTGQSPNYLVKNLSASCQWGRQHYSKDDTFRSRAIAHTSWAKQCIAKYYLKPTILIWSKAFLTKIHWSLSIKKLFSFFYVLISLKTNPHNLSWPP